MHAADQNFVTGWTDKYFLRTKEVIDAYGDMSVEYAVFMRRPVISAPQLMINWLLEAAELRRVNFDIDLCFKEGRWVGAGEPLLYIKGSFFHLVDLETLYLQKIGPTCLAAWNAFTMCMELPHVSFVAMDARHCAGTEMAELMAYAASVGSERAKVKANAVGFIGNATDRTCHYFKNMEGLGTMPHGLIGYAGSTLKAAQMYHKQFPASDLVVLVDYFGQEITDSLEVCNHFKHLAEEGRLGIRLDTPGSRFIEGLDPLLSYKVLNENAPDALRGYRTEDELKHLVGTGVSAAAIWYLRNKLDEAGFKRVKIVVSSGFGPEKCKMVAQAKCPIDTIGTGSFLPEKWSETYATADIISYNGTPSVKVGREFLFRKG